VVPESNAHIVKIPQDGAWGAEVLYSQNHVVVVQWDGIAVNDEVFVADADGDVRACPWKEKWSPFVTTTCVPWLSMKQRPMRPTTFMPVTKVPCGPRETVISRDR
jgi:hypothetical protein